jgi:hypothetical protein
VDAPELVAQRVVGHRTNISARVRPVTSNEAQHLHDHFLALRPFSWDALVGGYRPRVCGRGM